MALNANVTWDDLDPEHRKAFQTKFGMPTKDRLPRGMVIYKFNSFNTLHPPKDERLSPWWSPYEAYKQDAGWHQKLKMAQANGVSVREWGRLTSAVREDWNSLEYLLKITLADDVFGWFGGFSQMARIGAGRESLLKAGEARGGGKNLPGGATQLYIPNLTADHQSAWSAESLASL